MLKMDVLTSLEDLHRYMHKVNDIFPVEALLQQPFGKEQITRYYKNSSPGYRFFHSREGAVHMALNYDGIYHKAQGYFKIVLQK